MNFLILSLILLLFAEPALAWGPGMHFFLGQRLLEMGIIGGSLGALLRSNRKHFLYGNIIADVIVGKNMIDYEDHSHNWDVARSLRKHSSNPAQKAFATGYWTHLAADTVAHNLFLDEQETPSAITTSTMDHIYLELLADTWIPDSIPAHVTDLLSEDFASHRQFLEETVPRTVFPFAVNWFLTDNLLKYTGRGTTRAVANSLRRFHREDFELDRMEFFSEISLDRMGESLDENSSRIVHINPIAGGSRFTPREKTR